MKEEFNGNVLKGMLNALLLEGFAVIVIYGLFKIIVALLNCIGW